MLRLKPENTFHIRRKVDFHCRVIFTCVNKIEAMYERSRVNVKVNLAQLSRLRVAFHTLPLLHLRA